MVVGFLMSLFYFVLNCIFDVVWVEVGGVENLPAIFDKLVAPPLCSFANQS